MPSHLDDRELALLASAGHSRAWNELARRHSASVRSLLRRMGAQPSLADDIAQDAFVIAIERLESYRHEGAFGAWINRIASRLYVKRWRADARIVLVSDASDIDEIDLSTERHPSDRIDLDHALHALSDAERICVSLSFGAGFSNAEIAELMDQPLGTVKSHIKRGLQKLRATFEFDIRGERS